jgi:recombinational DNA repair ATPase RecF
VALAAVAAPVEATATRILQRIAGSRLGRVQLGDTFEPGHVLPELAERSVSVEQVSGGEREQIYLATRLALADVLARGERQLVVLDDVLTATDTGRLARVMGVLEEAAQRLQVLILNSGDTILNSSLGEEGGISVCTGATRAGRGPGDPPPHHPTGEPAAGVARLP